MILTEEQLATVEKLAGLNYTIRQLAMYLDLPAGDLQAEFDDRESKFRYHFDRGRLIAQTEIDMQAQDSAKKGNITAMQQYEKIRQARHFENMRDQIVNGNS